MFLRKITIKNFACFKEFSLDLAPSTTVIIGKNGAGKSSLIKAIVYVMNFLFTNDKQMGEGKYLSAGNPDLKMSSIRPEEFHRELSSDTAELESNFHGEMTFLGEEIVWDMYKKSTPGSSLYPSKYIDAYRQFMQMVDVSNRLPLLAYYSDSFPHKMSNLSQFAKKEIDNSNNILRNFGYYQWDNDNSCTSIWQLRLVSSMAKVLSLNNEDSCLHEEINFITKKLKQFSKPFTIEGDDTFEINKVFFSFKGGEKPEVWLQFTDGRQMAFSNLPAGYLRLYSIVLDLSYRAYLLNKKNDLSTILGLVLIDEVDLHLHPSLEMEVLKRFESLFPHMQFVVTTHSPLVISGVNQKEKSKRILRLNYNTNSPEVIPDIYGIDYNTSMTDWMDVQTSNEEVDFLVNSIIRTLNRGEIALVRSKLHELSKMVSDIRFNEIITQLKKGYDLQDALDK